MILILHWTEVDSHCATKHQARNTYTTNTMTSGLGDTPTPDIKGISFKCFYNPLILWWKLRLKDSIIEVCNGVWRVYGLKPFLKVAF